MLHKKRSKWSLGVLLLVALGLLVGLASMATAKKASGTPAGIAPVGERAAAPLSKRSIQPPAVVAGPSGQKALEGSVSVPNDDCTTARDISAAINNNSTFGVEHRAIWLPRPLSEAGLRPQDVYQATNNFAQDTPTCGYSEDGIGWADHHSRSVWYTYQPDANGPDDGFLYLTTYDPMFTHGGIHDTSGDTYRTDYDTVITVFTTEGGNWCGTFTSEDWVIGPHNTQIDDINYFNVEHNEPTDFPIGGNFRDPDPMTGVTWPMFKNRNYASYRERSANDWFWPGNHFAGSVDCVDLGFGLNTDQSAVTLKVKKGITYFILVQHYWYPTPTGYCPTDLVLDGTFIPSKHPTQVLGTTANPLDYVNAQEVALSFAANGRVWQDGVFPYDWLANYHPNGSIGDFPQIPFAEFAYDPFNAAYFFYDDMTFNLDRDNAVANPKRVDKNRRADKYWVNSNFFLEDWWDRQDAPGVNDQIPNDRIDDFTRFGFASRSAQSQMHNWVVERRQAADAGVAAAGFNRWFVDTRAVDNENWAGNDSLNLLRQATPNYQSSGFAYSFTDYDNDFRLDVDSDAAQNNCNTHWPPWEPHVPHMGDPCTWPEAYNFLSATGSPVATVAVKVPTTVWNKDRCTPRFSPGVPSITPWEQGLQATHSIQTGGGKFPDGEPFSGEFIFHAVNDTVNPLAILPEIHAQDVGKFNGAVLGFTYDEDESPTPCTPPNLGDTGPTWGHYCYLSTLALDTVEHSNIAKGEKFKILAATVGLDDTIKGYDCHRKDWVTNNTGCLVPERAKGINPDIMPRQSAIIYFIDEYGALWCVRDEKWDNQINNPLPNGMPNIYDVRNYHVLIPAKNLTKTVDNTGWDLRNAVAMTYNGTTGELLIALHGTGGPFGTWNAAKYNSSKIIRVRDLGPADATLHAVYPEKSNPLSDYKGLYIHDPVMIHEKWHAGRAVELLLWNHESAVNVPLRHDYMFNFDNTTGFGGWPRQSDATTHPLNQDWPGWAVLTPGPIELYPKGSINPNWYGIAAQMGPVGLPGQISDDQYLCYSQHTYNAGLALGPTETRWDGTDWNNNNYATKHIFGIGGREDYLQEAAAEVDPVQKGGADPNYWMTHILDFMAADAALTDPAAQFAWRDDVGIDGQLNTWAQDLPYVDQCEGFFHGMTGLDYWHDNSRPDVWLDEVWAQPPCTTLRTQIEDVDPATTCFSAKTCSQTMYDVPWKSSLDITWYSWDFAGTGVVGYDMYLFVYTNVVADGVYNPHNWTVRSLFAQDSIPEVAGHDVKHGDALIGGNVLQHQIQSYRYELPCDLTGESFIRVIAYDKEGHTSFHDGHPFYLGVQSNLAADLDYLRGQVVHRTDPKQAHRVIPIQWTYDPDTCILGGVQLNRTDNDCGRLEFEITFDGGYTWQCMHELRLAPHPQAIENADFCGQKLDLPAQGPYYEHVACCINPNQGQVGNTNLHTYDMMIPDYYADRYPYTHQVAIRMYWRQKGCECPRVGSTLITQSPHFSIADELGPIIVTNTPAGQYKPGEIMPITWRGKDGIWAPIATSCQGWEWDADTVPTTKAWFSTDHFDNWGTTSYDIVLEKADGTFLTVVTGLAGNLLSYDWAIPADFETGSYNLRVIGHDDYGNTSYFEDLVPPVPAQYISNSNCQHSNYMSWASDQFQIVPRSTPDVCITAPTKSPVQSYDPSNIVNVAWTVNKDTDPNQKCEGQIIDPSLLKQWVTVSGPSYNKTFDATNSDFNWAVPIEALYGEYTITVHAADLSNLANPGTDSVKVNVNDVVAPIITSLVAPAEVKQGGSASISVSATDTNGTGVTLYMINITGPDNYSYSDSKAGTTSADFTWAVPLTLKPGYYTVTARAKDNAGNVSEPSSKVIVIKDEEAPTVDIKTPQANAKFNPGETVNITWEAKDNTAVHHVTLTITGTLEAEYNQTFDSVTSAFNWIIPNNAAGEKTFTIKAIAYDNAGNASAPDSVTIGINDTKAPVISSFKANGNNPGVGNLGETVNFTLIDSDYVGVTSEVITITGPGYTNVLGAGVKAWPVPAGGQPGNYLATAKVCDAAGNCSEENCIIVIKDATAPTVGGFKVEPASIIPGGNVAFSWTASDNVAVVAQTLRIAGPGGFDQSYLIPASSKAYSLSFPVTATLGTYTCTLNVCDAAPNCTTATTSFSIGDSVAPVVAITAPVANLLVNVGSALNITWTATDNVGVINQFVKIQGPAGYSQTFDAASSSYNWAVPMVSGDYTITAYAKDAAGNEGHSAGVAVRVRVFPAITVAHKVLDPAFKIQLFGTNFQMGCTVSINGTAIPANNVTFKNGGKLLLKNVKDMCPKGVEVKILVVNPDGGYSNLFGFTR